MAAPIAGSLLVQARIPLDDKYWVNTFGEIDNGLTYIGQIRFTKDTEQVYIKKTPGWALLVSPSSAGGSTSNTSVKVITERINSFPYTTLQTTTYDNIIFLEVKGLVNRKPSRDNTFAPDYKITFTNRDKAIIESVGVVPTSMEASITYLLATSSGTTETTNPSTPPMTSNPDANPTTGTSGGTSNSTSGNFTIIADGNTSTYTFTPSTTVAIKTCTVTSDKNNAVVVGTTHTNTQITIELAIAPQDGEKLSFTWITYF